MDSEDILDSWKAIAHYLNRSIRTCQRLEQEAGLPIRRLEDSAKSRIYAFRSEIDRWLEKACAIRLHPSGWRLAKLFAVLALAAILVGAFLAYQAGLFSPRSFASGGKRLSLVILQLRNETGDGLFDYLRSRLQRQLMVEVQASANHISIVSEPSIFETLESLGLSGKDDYSESEIRAIMKRTDATHLFLGHFWKSGESWTLDYGLYVPKGPPVQGFIKNEPEKDRLPFLAAGQLLAALGSPAAEQSRLLSPEAAGALGDPDPYFYEAKKAERAYFSDCDEADLLRAIELYRKAVASHPDNALAHFGLGHCYQNHYIFHGGSKLGYDAMVYCYAEALRLAPDLPEAQLGLGWSRLFSGARDEAYAWFKKAHDLAPFSPTVNYHIGTFLGSIGLLDKAILYLSNAIDFGERSTRAYRMRAFYLMLDGRYRAAENDLAKLCELNPTNGKVLSCHARSLLMLKDFAGAGRELDVAEILAPGDLGVRLMRGLLWSARGEKDKALEASRPALESPLRWAHYLSGIYALLGLEEEAIRQIEQAMEQGAEELHVSTYPYEYLACKRNFFYAKIRNRPDFKRILQKLRNEREDLLKRYDRL